VAWRLAVQTQGGTVSDARFELVNSLLAGIKSDGITNLDRIGLPASENPQQANTDLLVRAKITLVGGMTQVVDRGYTPAVTFSRDAWLDRLRGRTDFREILLKAKQHHQEARAAFVQAGGQALLGAGSESNG